MTTRRRELQEAAEKLQAMKREARNATHADTLIRMASGRTITMREWIDFLRQRNIRHRNPLKRFASLIAPEPPQDYPVGIVPTPDAEEVKKVFEGVGQDLTASVLEVIGSDE